MSVAELQNSAFSASVAKALALTRIQSKTLRVAVDNGNQAQTIALTEWFLTALEPRLYFAVQVARSGKVKPSPTPDECLSVAQALDLRQAPSEKVIGTLRAKASGKHRLILNFGHAHRTAQGVLRVILSAHHRPQPFQFTHRGPKKAMEQVRRHIEAGNLWFAHLDIKEFYPSFRFEKLGQDAALGGILPSKTLAGFVHARNLEVAVTPVSLKRFPYLTHTHLHWEARRGIPTGSCVSSVVAPMMVSRLPLSQAAKELLTNYEDDFLQLATSKAELDKAVEAFMVAVRDVPGGRFTVKTKSTGCLLESEISFLGHRITVCDDQARIGINSANEQKLFMLLDDFDIRKGEFALRAGSSETKQRRRNCQRVVDYLDAWARAFSLCGPEVEEIKAMGMYAVEQELHALGLSINSLGKTTGNGDFTIAAHINSSELR